MIRNPGLFGSGRKRERKALIFTIYDLQINGRQRRINTTATFPDMSNEMHGQHVAAVGRVTPCAPSDCGRALHRVSGAHGVARPTFEVSLQR